MRQVLVNSQGREWKRDRVSCITRVQQPAKSRSHSAQDILVCDKGHAAELVRFVQTALCESGF